MDEFCRLKVMYPTPSPRELAEFQFFARAVAAHREDGRGSEDRGEDNREDTGDDRRRGRHSQQVAARIVVKIIVKTPVTTAGGAGTASKWQRGPW